MFLIQINLHTAFFSESNFILRNQNMEPTTLHLDL